MSFVYDIVIIGAGPGGIASVVEAEKADITNTMVIEKMGNHSYMIERFYKKGKRVDKDWQGKKFEFIGNVTFEECLKEEFIEQMETLIVNEGVEDKFLYNQEIYGVQKNEDNDLFELDTHNHGVIEAKNVIVAIGRMGKPNKPGYKFPAKIRKVLNFNLSDVKEGEKVMIVGGGDTAGEYAYGLVDLGMNCEVTLNYRRAEIARMNPTNKEITEKYMAEGKIKNKLGVDVESVEPVEIEGEEQAKVKVNFTDGSSEVYDRVVYALGGTSPKDFLKNSNIEMNEWGEPIVNEETMETNIKGLYTIGDVTTSAGSIALAFNHAYMAVSDISKKLKA